jgi:two-component system, sensor histidine kinase ChiS
MQQGAILLIIYSLILFSCNPKQATEPLPQSYVPLIVQAIPTMVHPDSIFDPDTLYVSGEKRWLARPPDRFLATTYRLGSLKEKQITVGAPQIIYPGHDTIPLPKIISRKDSVRLAGIPEIIEAKDEYFPASNSQSISYYTRLQGLPHDDISAIAKDKNGNMWIGTYGAGVVRFDGLNFYQYKDTDGLSQNFIQTLVASKVGDIWIGTRAEGAMRFNGRNIYYYTTDNGLPNNRVETIFEDSRGIIWLGTYNGVCRIDGQDITSYTKAHGLGIEIVYMIQEDKNGNMWFGGVNGGITMFDGNAFYQYSSQQGLTNNYIVTGTYDSKGNLWFGTYENGAYRFDGTSFYQYTTNEGLENNSIKSISEDLKGNIWIGSSEGSLSKLKENDIYLYGEEHGISNGFITCFYHDRDGSVWFGTFGGGLGHFKGNMFTHFHEKYGLKDGFIRSIMQDNEGQVWLGTNTEGAFSYDGTSFMQYSTMQGLSHNRVGGMLQDKNGLYWFATTGGGITSFDGQVFTNYRVENGLNDDFIIFLREDSGGNIWFVTRDNGILKYNGEYFLSYGTHQGLSDTVARFVLEDKKGNIWVGTQAGGITRFDGKTVAHYNKEGGLLSNNIIDMIEDSNGNIWIGTNGNGVTAFDGNYYYHFTEKQGLINDFVYSLLDDKDQNIWIGTRMGLSKLLVKDFSELINQSKAINSPIKVLFRNYSHMDGYLGVGTNSRTMLQDQEGNIWIGANDILTVYNPREDVVDSIPPKVKITTVGIFNERIQWQSLQNHQDTVIVLPNGLVIKNFKFDDISDWYGLPVNLSLSYDNNHISFDFVGISNGLSKDIRYQYILEGLYNNWSSLTKETHASFGRLAPGKYTFKVKAVNDDGYWSEEITYSFHITPPFWQTPMAYAGYLLLSILLGLIIYKYRKRLSAKRELAKQKDIEWQQEVAIARKSAEFKQNFLANMSHEIRTPLTGVLGLANLLSQLPLDQKAKEYVDDLNKTGESLRDTINMILDISKIEAGKLQIKKTSFSLYGVFEDCVKLYTPLCKENVVLETIIDNEIPRFIYTDEQRVSQIIKNLLSNAVKFTTQGKITLKARLEKTEYLLDQESYYIKIIVSDTGQGIGYQEQQKLFAPFYQAEQNPAIFSEGTGLGLAICKELSILLGGHIGMESHPGQGSLFWFTFRAQTGKSPKTKGNLPLKIKTNLTETVKSLNILLVEDKQIIQKVVSLMLNSMGHSVIIASNGEDALKKFIPGFFDLVLMDIQMPVMDGISATQKLRENHNQLPPIVGLSANAFEGDRKKYMDQGLDEYLTKPIAENDFREMLQKIGLK